MKFWEDMPDAEAKDDLVIMVGDAASPNSPKRTTLAKIKAFIKGGLNISFGDLNKKPKIGGVELIEGNNSLDALGLQAKGSYIDQDTLTQSLADKLDVKVEGLPEVDLKVDKLENLMIRVRQEGEGEEESESMEKKMSVKSLYKAIAIYEVEDEVSKEIVHDFGEDFYPSIKFLDLEGNSVVISERHMAGLIIVSWNDKKSGKIILTR